MSESKGKYCENPGCSHIDAPGNKSKHPKRLVYPDVHKFCLRCLPLDHDPDNCEICLNFSNKTRDSREMAVKEFKATGVWPDKVNTKSLDKLRAKERASSTDRVNPQSRERSHSSRKGKKDHVSGTKDFTKFMTAATQLYQFQGQQVRPQNSSPEVVKIAKPISLPPKPTLRKGRPMS